ncbi:MAG TPA: enoyl-CoA hydratase-related protein [Anaerolineae bacterium]|nr:enoyl-CoA hydratase-related protein [Anaerolineae bacterium]
MSDITTTLTDNILTITLDRPATHNAMTPNMIAELTAAFAELDNRADVRVVVLTGNGRSFCAGADLNAMRAAADYTFEQNVADGGAIFDLMHTINACLKPVIGRINGAAIGGGAGLVSCCDLVIAVDRAKFAFSEARLGIVPAVISPFVLAKIGASHGRRLFLTGERFTAADAHHIGLVHVVTPEDELDAATETAVNNLLQAAPGAQAAVKTLINHVHGQPPAAMRDYTTNLIAQRRASDEGREGMSSFLEKRPPNWRP